MIPTFLAIDVGNSSIKWGLFDQGILIEYFRLGLADVSSWEKSWNARCKDSVKSILICGVVPDALKKHHRWFLDFCDKVIKSSIITILLPIVQHSQISICNII